jgi:hypothetical protein
MTTDISSVTLRLPDNSIAGRALLNNAEILRSQMKQVSYDTTPIPLSHMRTWDSMATNLPATAATDDLGFVTGTPGADSPMLSADDVKTTSSARKAAFELEVPGNWEDGESLAVRMRAAMETTIADGSCTIDLEAWLGDGTGAAGSDLVSTAAQDMNSVTPANFDFELTTSGVTAGDLITCVITITYADTATVTAVTPVIYSVSRRADTQG